MPGEEYDRVIQRAGVLPDERAEALHGSTKVHLLDRAGSG
jgi:hypothetical protein